MRAFTLLATVAAAMGCARAMPPPGGEEDRIPPQIVGTVPDPLAVIDATDEPVVFTFDNTLGERGISDASVLVSPATSDWTVQRSGNALRIRLEDGWRAGVIYHVVLLPGLQDRFRNETREPAELVFSTGPEITQTVIAGLALERITGRAAENVVVRARSRADSLQYQTVPDSAGFFALQHLPPGTYDLAAWEDVNRNREQDDREGFARGSVVTLNRAIDTLTAVLQIVPWDTTPPRPEVARAVDSLQIRVTTDDYLDPDASLEFVQVSLVSLPDSTEVPGTARALSTAAFDSMRAAQDTLPPDSLEAARPAVPALPAAQDTVTLPRQDFVVIPPIPLVAGGHYELRVEGLTNITGRSGGGGSVRFEVPETPAIPTDTTAAPPPDTTFRARSGRRLR